MREKIYYPNKPEPIGVCHHCGKPLKKTTALWCNRGCRKKYYRIPSENLLVKWDSQGISKATDGCIVEPDGICPHGYRSWLLELGFI